MEKAVTDETSRANNGYRFDGVINWFSIQFFWDTECNNLTKVYLSAAKTAYKTARQNLELEPEQAGEKGGLY